MAPRTHAPLSEGEVWGGGILVAVGGIAFTVIMLLLLRELCCRRKPGAPPPAGAPRVEVGSAVRQPYNGPVHRMRAPTRSMPYRPPPVRPGLRIPPAALIPLRAGAKGGLVVDRRQWR